MPESPLSESPYEAFAQISIRRRAVFLFVAAFSSASLSAALAFVASVQTSLWAHADGTAPILLALGTLSLALLFNLFFLLALVPRKGLQAAAFWIPVVLPIALALAIADPVSSMGRDVGAEGPGASPLLVAAVLTIPFLPSMLVAPLVGSWYRQRFGVGAGEGWEPEVEE